MPYLEYKITSSLGDWPEVFTNLQDVANDLEWCRIAHPDIEYGVMVRVVYPWQPNLQTLPEPDEWPGLVAAERDCPSDTDFANLEEGTDG